MGNVKRECFGQVLRLVGWQMRDKVKGPVEWQIGGQVGWKLYEKVSEQVWEQIVNLV